MVLRCGAEKFELCGPGDNPTACHSGVTQPTQPSGFSGWFSLSGGDVPPLETCTRETREKADQQAGIPVMLWLHFLPVGNVLRLEWAARIFVPVVLTYRPGEFHGFPVH